MTTVEEVTVFQTVPHIYGKEVFHVPVCYKMDVLAALKEKGYSTYKLRKEKVFSENTLQAFRSGKMVSYETIGKLCEMLGCDVGDILMYRPEGE